MRTKIKLQKHQGEWVYISNGNLGPSTGYAQITPDSVIGRTLKDASKRYPLELRYW